MAPEAIGGVSIPMARPQAPVTNVRAVDPTAPTAPPPSIAADGVVASAKADAPGEVAAVNVERVDLTAPKEPQFFGHQPGYSVSMFMKQPVWKDDRQSITGEQWAQMPESQRKEILALIPNEPAKAQFLSNVDPAVMKAKAELSASVKNGWNKAQEWAQRHEKVAPGAPPATP